MPGTSSRQRQRIIYLNLTQFYSAATHRGIVAYAVEHNWSLVYKVMKPGSGLLSSLDHYDGAIVHGGTRVLVEAIQNTIGIPVVVTTGQPADARVKHIIFNNEAIGRMAAEHLIEKGFRRLVMVRTTNDHPSKRYLGFAAAAAEHPGTEASLCLVSDLTDDYLTSLPRPYAITLVNDTLAAEVIYRLEDCGLRIPVDVGVLGIDNNPLYCETTPVPLSSIEINADKRGHMAACYLDQMMAGIEVPLDTVSIEPDHVVIRASTDINVIDHQPTAAAVQYIRTQLSDPDLSIADIVKHAGISRRSLENAFKEHLKRSIASEILAQRIDRAINLIRQGQRPLATVAAACGFSSPQALSGSFMRALGRTPSSFRPNRKTGAD